MSKTSVVALALCLAAGASGTGCLAGGEVRATAAAPTPRLVWIGPDLWVVESNEQPVFYYGGHYWLYADGWYRSPYFDGGFVRIDVVPTVVVRIHQPRAYVRYRAPHGARVRVIDRRSSPRAHRRR
jgi:hypothetical protein